MLLAIITITNTEVNNFMLLT